MLGALRRIPGRNKLDEVELDRLLSWIGSVRHACAELGREKVGDHSLGKLLSHAPEGKDGIWPSEPVRDALERIRSEDVSGGAGLGVCSHFIALLSPVALTKPWVNAEMDGAFVRKLAGACRFIALRHGLAPEGLPGPSALQPS